jgi:hypothetical protein
LSEFKTAEASRDVGTTKATATLPGLTIEISHHRPPEGDREEIAIKLQAVPSFDAFGSLFEAKNPFAFWANATQLAWSSWFQAAQAMMPPSNMLLPPASSDDRKPSSGTSERHQ